MENDKKVWRQLSSFLKREVSITLLFWLIVFSMVIAMKFWEVV
jgi:hypothetical protein